MKQHPTHAVDDRSVVRVERKRLLDVVVSFLVPVERVRQQIPQCIQESGIVGHIRNDRFERRCRPAQAALLLVEQCLRVSKRKIIRVEAQTFAQQIFGQVELRAPDGRLSARKVSL